MTKRYLRRQFVIILAVCSVIGAGCTSQRVIVAGEDVVSLPNRQIHVSAKIEQQNIFLKDIEHQPIEFRLLSAPAKVKLCLLKNGFTDREGVATATVGLTEPGLYEIQAKYPGNHRYRSGEDVVMVLAVPPHRPVLVLDVDNTLTQGNWLEVKPEPIPFDKNTVRVVNELSRRYAIVYLSARPRPLHKRTRIWLRKYGFPDGPILLWYPFQERWLSPSRFKRYELADLRKDGVNLAVGISNTTGDTKTYLRAGMKAIIVGKEIPDAQSAHDWAQIESILLEEATDR